MMKISLPQDFRIPWPERMKQSLSKVAYVLGGISIVGFLFWNLAAGSMFNSDEALYAQIARGVFEGHVWPLHFWSNVYFAKPPLYFWITGFFLRLFGDLDWVYRLIPTLSLIGILAITFHSLSRLTMLALLGSPLLMVFSRKVMLDVPTTFWGVAMLIAATRPSNAQRMFVWLFAALGWWTKQQAILPPLAAVMIYYFITERSMYLQKSFWIGCATFLFAVSFLYFFQDHQLFSPIVTASAVRSNAEGYLSRKPIYFEAFSADHPLLWFFPLTFITSCLRISRPEQARAFLFGLASILSLISLFIVRATLPHYLIPAFVFGLISVSETLFHFENRKAATIFALVLVLQLTRANLFRFDVHHPDIDSAPATKAIAHEAAQVVPPGVPLCALDTYFVGFGFEAKRMTLGFYRNQKALESIAGVAEFSGLVFDASYESDPSWLKTRCGGYVIMPTALGNHSPQLAPQAVHEPIGLYKTIR